MSDTTYILLPVHNRREITRRFIECLQAQTHRNFHLVLIDDGSSDGTAEMVRENIQPLTIIRGTGGWWWGGSLQQGYLWLKRNKVPDTDLVLIINDDTEFEQDFLGNALRHLGDRRATLLLAEGYDKRTKALCATGVRADWKHLTFNQSTSGEQINCLPTRGLFMRMGDFKIIGGFYPKLLPHYLSDYEFTMRAARKGMQLSVDSSVRLFFDREATGYHKLASRSLGETLVFYFSKKSAANILAWTSFLVLACPFRWKVINLVRVWAVAIKQIGQSAIVTFAYRISGKKI